MAEPQKGNGVATASVGGGYRSDGPATVDLPAGERFVSFAPGNYLGGVFVTEPRKPDQEPRRLSILGIGHTPGSMDVRFYIQEH